MLPVFSSPNRTIIDCGASRTALGVFNLSGGRLQCLHAAVEPFPVRAVGEDRWLENTITAFRALNAGHQWTGPAVLVLPAHLTLTKLLKVPRVEPAKREKIIRFEAEQAIPYALNEVVWATVNSGQPDAEQVILVAAKRDIITQLCAAAQAAGFTPRRVLPSFLATLAGYRLTQPVQAQATLVLNLGARSTTLLQVEGQRFVARSLTLGGSSLTQQLAENQEGEADEAERIKLSEGSGGLVTDAMETLVTRLTQEITRSVLHFGRQCGMANPERVFLTGGTSGLRGFPETLAARLQLPVECFDARGAVELSVAPALILTDLIGAATIELRPPQPTMNLLPLGLSRQVSRRHQQPRLLAAVVLLVAAWVPPLIHYQQVTATARVKLAAMEEALEPLRAREFRNRKNLAQLVRLKSQVALYQSIHDGRAGWLQLFTGLQERLVKVEDVWLEKLQTIPPTPGVAMKLVVSGRMLDKTNPLAMVSPETFTRVKDLLGGIADLPSVAAVEGEHFDNSQPGILKFDFVLVIDPAHLL